MKNQVRVEVTWLAGCCLRYHAPSDDMSQPFDFDGAVEIMQINFLVGYDVAQASGRPTWNMSDFFGKTFGTP